MGITPSVNLQVPVNYNYFCLGFGHTDRLRLIYAPEDILFKTEQVLSATWSIQDIRKSNGFAEFKLAGSPWYEYGESDLNVKYFICALLKQYYESGWYLSVSADLQRGSNDSSSLIFQRGPPISTYTICLSLNSTDKIRYLGPQDLIPTLRETINQAWPFGIQREQLFDKSLEFKLKVATSEKLEKLGDLLINESVPMKARYRALFTLKNLGGDDAVHNIAKGFKDSSALLKHECAYCLGQMQNESAIDILIDVLKNKTEDPMVRHEAGEALGAIGKNTQHIIEVLTEYSKDSHVEVAETCQLALERLEWLEKQKQGLTENLSENPYFSVDPAPPDVKLDVEYLKSKLLDESLSMFERYRAMFALRNIGSDEAVLALCSGLKCKSALFRHEIAYVLGQVQNPVSIDALRENLEDVSENHMVRHECAEALGSLATDKCVEILNKYLKDKEAVVKESCEVALDITDYEKSGDFQYANGLLAV